MTHIVCIFSISIELWDVRTTHVSGVCLIISVSPKLFGLGSGHQKEAACLSKLPATPNTVARQQLSVARWWRWHTPKGLKEQDWRLAEHDREEGICTQSWRLKEWRYIHAEEQLLDEFILLGAWIYKFLLWPQRHRSDGVMSKIWWKYEMASKKSYFYCYIWADLNSWIKDLL